MEDMSIETIQERIRPIIKEAEWKDRVGIFTEPPVQIPTPLFPDAPLLGNGDVGVAIGGGPELQTFFIGKNDFWVQPFLGETEDQRRERLLNDEGRRTGARIITVGQVNLQLPAMIGADYRQEQDILNAEVRGTFQNADHSLRLCSWVCAEANLLITELVCERGEMDVKVILHAGESGTDEVFSYDNGVETNALWFRYASNMINVPDTRRVAVAVRLIGGDARYEWKFSNVEAEGRISAGQTVYLATSIVSNRDEADYFQEALASLPASAEQIMELKKRHREWWRNFYCESFIEIGDPVLEKFYYASNYITASCMRAGKVPPGLFGNWVTTDRPKWTGSYTINYNYQAPYWGHYSGNHLALAEPYCEPVLDILPWGNLFAREKLNCRGVYLPVELGPWGMVCSMAYHEQKSNAGFLAVNLLMHYRYTCDEEYGRRIYPFIRGVADFWEDYLTFEDGKYVIYDDSIHERSHDKKNPILSLGFVRMIMEAALELSSALEMDGDRHAKWQHILEHLSPYPIMERNGKIVFRLTEIGREWGMRNSLAMQHVFPAGMIGLDSDPELLKIAWNTVDEMQRWSDFNAFATYYVQAARVGYHPQIILEKLRKECEEHAFPNLVIYHGGGGIEDCSAVPACLQEMLLQSYEGVIRLFPVWPEDRDARFGKLRGAGAFVISAERKDREVQYVVIESEKGRPCTIQNPWPGNNILVYRNGKLAETAEGERFTVETSCGEQLVLVPKGKI